MTDYTSSQSMSDTTLTAFFDSQSDARNAIAQLRDLGIPETGIRLTEGAGGGAEATTSVQPEEKGFFERLGDFFMPDEDRHVYAEGLARGGYLLTVSGVPVEQQDAALDILENAGAADVDEREAAWRAEGWSGHAGSQSAGSMTAASATAGSASAGSAALAGGTGGRPMEHAEGEAIPVVEEHLRVGKRDVGHGRVRVRSYVRETPVEEQVNLTSERVDIERNPVDRAVGAGDDPFRERSIEAEEHAEEAVVAKEARVVEEVNLRRTQESHRETVSDTVRHTEVEVEDERSGTSETATTPTRGI
jgi:uncharacterized protein (TIGR02271 family)